MISVYNFYVQFRKDSFIYPKEILSHLQDGLAQDYQIIL